TDLSIVQCSEVVPGGRAEVERTTLVNFKSSGRLVVCTDGNEMVVRNSVTDVHVIAGCRGRRGIGTRMTYIRPRRSAGAGIRPVAAPLAVKYSHYPECCGHTCGKLAVDVVGSGEGNSVGSLVNLSDIIDDRPRRGVIPCRNVTRISAGGRHVIIQITISVRDCACTNTGEPRTGHLPVPCQVVCISRDHQGMSCVNRPCCYRPIGSRRRRDLNGGRGITGDRTEGERERREVTVGLANSPVRLIPGSPDHLGVAERIARGRYSCRRSRRQGKQILVDVEDTVAVTRQGKGTGNCYVGSRTGSR